MFKKFTQWKNMYMPGVAKVYLSRWFLHILQLMIKRVLSITAISLWILQSYPPSGKYSATVASLTQGYCYACKITFNRLNSKYTVSVNSYLRFSHFNRKHIKILERQDTQFSVYCFYYPNSNPLNSVCGSHDISTRRFDPRAGHKFLMSIYLGYFEMVIRLLTLILGKYNTGFVDSLLRKQSYVIQEHRFGWLQTA